MNDQSRPDEERPETHQPEANEPDESLQAHTEAHGEDPIGDETDGEAESSTEAESEEDIEASEEDTEDEAQDEEEDGAEFESDEASDSGEEDSRATDPEDADDEESEFKPKKRPPVKLERLQKILAQSGVASRRKAEEMIEQGRVQVNGKVVTELGTKADMGRDHIRVDGKLLQGAERLRYFVLNKPRGFVTTVKDPEGRPTVMQFFDKMKERLYPVGRLDYMSEGLLLVTNDGELANRLTKASSGVEKTYLVKVAGIPSEGELDVLRSGVAIDKGKPGTGKVRTSPARIRQVRQGDNPWYEVVLIEGRNRELRKMFEEVGHFVEKIRRVGYGPLILDQEPGNLRELDAQELELLRKAADGKLKTPKAKEIRRRNLIDSLPPQKQAPKARGERPAAGPKDYKPKRAFGTDKPARSGPSSVKTGGFKPGAAKFGGPDKFGAGRPTEGSAPRPAWKKDAPPARPTGRFEGRPPARFTPESTGEGRPAPRSFGDRPAAGRTFGAKPAARPFTAKPSAGKPFGDKPATGRSFPGKPAWKKPEAGGRDSGGRESNARPGFKKPFTPRSESTRKPAPENFDDLGPKKSFKFEIEPVQDFGRSERPSRPTSSRPPAGYSGQGRTGAGRTGTGRASSGRSGPGRPGAGSSRPSSPRPFRSEGGLARPFTTSSGKPRPGGARPSSKPGREGGRPSGPPAGRGDSRPSFAPKRPFRPREEGGASGSRPARPFTPRSDSPRPERRFDAGEGSGGRSAGGTGWKPKPSFSGGKPASGGGFKSKPGGFSKPKSGGPGSKGGGYKGSGGKPKPGSFGAKRSGPRSGGKRP